MRPRIPKELMPYVRKLKDMSEDEVIKIFESTQTVPNDYENEGKLSAINPETGKVMNISDYCTYYNLPYEDVTSYKFVSHTGTPYYNIVFKERIVRQVDFDAVICRVVDGLSIPKKEAPSDVGFIDTQHDYTDRLIFSDVHIGMDTNQNGHALYPIRWDEQEQRRRFDAMAAFVLKHKRSSRIYVDDLGDFLDGWDGQTVRKGHDLPQNMDNEKAYEVALSLKMRLCEMLASSYAEVIFHNVCNDNHAGSFAYVLNHAFKQLCSHRYKNVAVVNLRSFIGHYTSGNRAFVLSHGKDSKTLKFGFKPHLDTKQIEKIDQYLKSREIYKTAEHIEFSKGDSHQALMDYSGSDDFDYCNYPAFSPSSEWVQTNYKKGRSGFVMQHFNDTELTIKPYWF